MQLTSKKIDNHRLREIVWTVSMDAYDGNVDCGAYAGTIGTPDLLATRRDGRMVTRFTLTCHSSRGMGARRIGTQMRRSIHATWQAHYDVMAAIYEIDADAKIHTGMATYRDREHFLTTAGATYFRNVGSHADPKYIGSM